MRLVYRGFMLGCGVSVGASRAECCGKAQLSSGNG